jgi:hypothetical protein
VLKVWNEISRSCWTCISKSPLPQMWIGLRNDSLRPKEGFMNRQDFARLPTFGGESLSGIDAFRIAYCFYDCLRCKRDIGGYEAVAERDPGTFTYFNRQVYHPHCYPSEVGI